MLSNRLFERLGMCKTVLWYVWADFRRAMIKLITNMLCACWNIYITQEDWSWAMGRSIMMLRLCMYDNEMLIRQRMYRIENPPGSGIVIKVFGNVVMWRSHKQTTVSKASTQALDDCVANESSFKRFGCWNKKLKIYDDIQVRFA